MCASSPNYLACSFLRNEAGNGYQILDPTYPAVIAPANAVPTNEQGLDRTQVLLAARSAEDRRLAVRVLRSAQTDRATELLPQSAKDKDVVVKMKGWANLGAAQFMTSGHYRSLKSRRSIVDSRYRSADLRISRTAMVRPWAVALPDAGVLTVTAKTYGPAPQMLLSVVLTKRA